MSIDLARGLSLAEVQQEDEQDSVELRPVVPPRKLRDLNARVAIARWPAGHRIVVGSLDGGVGRTVVASGLAAVLSKARTPRTLLVDGAAHRLSETATRWGVAPGSPTAGDIHAVLEDPAQLLDRLGTSAFDAPTLPAVAGTEGPPPAAAVGRVVGRVAGLFGQIVIDSPVGPPCDQLLVQTPDESGLSPAAVVMVCRPDEWSLHRMADVAVWMGDHADFDVRNRLTVLVNAAAGKATRRSRTAQALLATRCHAVHHLPFDKSLATGAPALVVQRLGNQSKITLAQVLLGSYPEGALS